MSIAPGWVGGFIHTNICSCCHGSFVLSIVSPFDRCVNPLLHTVAAHAVTVFRFRFGVRVSVPTVMMLREFLPRPLSHSGPLQPLGGAVFSGVLLHVTAALSVISGWLKLALAQRGLGVQNRSATINLHDSALKRCRSGVCHRLRCSRWRTPLRGSGLNTAGR